MFPFRIGQVVHKQYAGKQRVNMILPESSRAKIQIARRVLLDGSKFISLIGKEEGKKQKLREAEGTRFTT